MLLSLRLQARTFVAVCCTALAVTFLGASTANFFGTPALIIFALRPSNGMDPSVGVASANQLGAALKVIGGVNVVVADPATVPADYLHAAKAASADYYFMGSFAPPTQNTLPLIEQIVSVQSGTVVWSSTAYVSAPGDVVSQAPIIKTALANYLARGYQDVLNPPPARAVAQASQAPSTPPPAKKVISSTVHSSIGQPGTDNPPVNLPNEVYGFSSEPTEAPKVYAAASHPSRFVLLNFVAKDLSPDTRDYAVGAIKASLERRGQTVAEADPLNDGHRLPSPELCADTGASYLVFGSVSATALDGIVNALLNVSLYSCGEQTFLPPSKGVHGVGSSWQTAVATSADAAVTQYLMEAPTVAK